MPGSLLTLLAVLAAAGVLTAAIAVALMAYGLLRPPRMNDGKALYFLRRLSPGDLGLSFEDVAFAVRDERTGRPLRINGWWIPAASSPAGESGRCAVLLHGYADAKVGAIAWAPMLHELGFHVLAIDLRAHGDSEGKHSTAAYFERHDVSQVIDQLRAERPRQTGQLFLFGISLGAAVAAATAALRTSNDDNPISDVAAVVLESPYADFRLAAVGRMARLGHPGGWLAAAALRLAEWVSGADFDAVRTVDLVGRISCPLLVLSTEGGECPSPADRASLEAALRSRPATAAPAVVRHLRIVPDPVRGALWPQEYLDCLREFFDSASLSESIAPP